ncbi:NADH-quinone oxidoreductase subunit D [Arcobacter sp. CECT 8986]|uniref:NADH dehydrogenase (quinone) subunit D n=1 Tax=Arcobacter sp. CECT 8986 TaxID=2044507 RepID=UPI001009DC2C|nr:NADH dehydrogenase (quinone) subunit D [Arcobacter sp. CECT 8986]RXJ98186.1 NADH-quinone oxidoreductase subunit D [Arcobacter sp. CECT 8986]
MQQQAPNRLKPFFENINFEREDNTMVVNFGPQHPSAHGQMRLILELKGEEVVKARPDIGYLHRGMEKMAENMIYNEFLPTTDRMDYIAATSNNYGFALAVEKLLDIEVPRRAEIIRTMLLELNRIVSHIFWLATHALDVGAMSVFLYTFREREFALDLIEDYCGARLTHSAVRIGGVPLDLPASWCENLEKYLQVLEKELENYEGLLTENRIWRMRLENVGVISPELAKSWGVTGIALRGSGIKWDLRKEMPYGIYPELDFDVPIATTGDAYGRYKCYLQEMRESIKILRQLIPMYKDSKLELMAHAPEYISAPKEQIMTQNYSLMQHFVLVTQGMRPPKGEVYVATEAPKGELGFMIVSDGTPYSYKLKVRAPSFFHTGLLEDLLPGCQLADVVTLIGNLNMVFGEIDR